MTYHAFICHPSQNADIVGNLAGQLRELGIEAWVYSLDRTLAKDVWREIEERIRDCRLFIFVASKQTLDAKGQHREVVLALDRLKKTNVGLRMFPVLIDDVGFDSLPEELSRINGLRLDAYTVKSTAHQIASNFFPELVEAEKSKDWICPRPGQWLKVCDMDQWIEEHFDLGDRVYFRRISPLGLFECYSPKLDDLFWFAPNNLCATDIVDEDGTLERLEVPRRYRYSASYDFERVGIDEMRKRGQLE